MKNFFKYAFFVLLIILLASTLFNSEDNRAKQSLDSNILIVESSSEIKVDENNNENKTTVDEGNIFAQIGAFFSNIIFQIFNLIYSFISNIFIVYIV